MKRKFLFFAGDLDPKDNRVALAPASLELGDWYSTTEIEDSTVQVKLWMPPANTNVDSRVAMDAERMFAQFCADWWLSVISFVEGCLFSTRINKVMDSCGRNRELIPRLRFGPNGEFLSINPHMEWALLAAETSVSKPHFSRALRDYAAALTWSRDAHFYCYRALEILSLEFGGGKNKRRRWNKMHQELGTNRCVIETLIKQHADKIRHGKEPDYSKSEPAAYDALTYVRDALRAFILMNPDVDTELEKPVLDHSRIPAHITPIHVNGCRCPKQR